MLGLDYLECDVKEIKTYSGKLIIMTDKTYIVLNFKDKELFRRLHSALIPLESLTLGVNKNE